MRKNTQRRIGLFLAMLLFLSGMYVDTVMTEAFFVYDTTGKIVSCHSDINDATICTSELISVCSAERLSHGGYQERVREMNDFLYMQCSGFGSLFRRKSCILHAARLLCRKQNELVTDYIHQSDGKKRI
ncbi:MAG: hypothetical protein K2P44_12300 [Lachnospiraceae bacterium]|nr:hypothetical protein [Lachnospiraceae bacterium]